MVKLSVNSKWSEERGLLPIFFFPSSFENHRAQFGVILQMCKNFAPYVVIQGYYIRNVS